MDWLTSFLRETVENLAILDFSILKGIVDLNDVRSLAAIAAAVFAVRAGMNKLGTKAVFRATVTFAINRPAHISNLTIANLKDRPLVVYEVLALFKEQKAFLSLHKFNPPLVIKNLEATSFAPEEFSSLSLQSNPFENVRPNFGISLVTDRDVVHCKPAKIEASLINKYLKGMSAVAKHSSRINGKIYAKDARYAILRQQDGRIITSFLLASGVICDEWPFRPNAIPRECLESDETVAAAIEAISEQAGVVLRVQSLRL